MEGQGALKAIIGARTIAVINTNLTEHKRQNQNYATSWWILTFYALRLFSEVVGQFRQVWRDKEIWGR
jgi:hypothetical protein